MALIKRSANELVALADKGLPATSSVWTNVLLPRPGCGNGGLNWKDVRPVIEPILDDRFIVVEYERG